MNILNYKTHSSVKLEINLKILSKIKRNLKRKKLILLVFLDIVEVIN
jgi:hypothetical protein